MTDQVAKAGEPPVRTEEDSGEPVRYSERGPVAVVTLNRPRYRNAQNSAMTYALDAAFTRAVNSPEVAVIVLAGEGEHFCAGHDIGTPGRDVDVSFDRQAVLWWDHVGRAGADARYAREMEVYLGMCRRWREMPKPAIAMVQGACIAGGLMLAWSCDLIVAAEDAFFADPVVRMGIPGVEYFAHPWVLGPRFAKEALFTGARFGARRAYELGMVNRVVPRAELAETTFAPRSGSDRTRRALLPLFPLLVPVLGHAVLHSTTDQNCVLKQGRQDLNLQPAVLETAALPIELRPYVAVSAHIWTPTSSPTLPYRTV